MEPAVPTTPIRIRPFDDRRIDPKWRLRGLVATAIAVLLLIVGFILQPAQTLFSYLVAFSFFMSITAGALCWLLVLSATGARWAVAPRRLLEIAAAGAPVFVLLFIPIAIGMSVLYPWVRPDEGAPHEVLELLHHKRPWLNVPFFLARAFIYLTLWSVLGNLLFYLSRWQDTIPRLTRVLLARRVGAVGLPVFGISCAFAAFDWIMSLLPTWYSTIFGVYWFAGGFLGAMAVWILACVGAEARGALPPGVLGAAHYHSMGKLLFAFVCFWAYIGFSQYMLIWIGNIPEETQYFVLRRERGYQPFFIFLILFHFVVPFFLLLPRRVKRSRRWLPAMALWVLVVHWVDSYWLVMPHRGPGAFFHWQDLVALLAVGGIVLGFAALRSRGVLPIPVGDPYLAESLAYER